MVSFTVAETVAGRGVGEVAVREDARRQAAVEGRALERVGVAEFQGARLVGVAAREQLEDDVARMASPLLLQSTKAARPIDEPRVGSL